MVDPQNETLDDSAAVTSAAALSNRKALFIVFLVVFIDLLGFAIVMPLLPRFGDAILSKLVEGGKDAPLTGVMLGLLMSSFSFMQFLFAPFWGRLSDRVGRRPVLLMGLAASAFFYTLFGVALTVSNDQPALGLAMIFMSRMGAGLAGATIGTAQAVIADSTPPDKRKHGMALIGMAFGIGFTLGPVFGYASLPAEEDATAPLTGLTGYLAAGLSLAALLLAVVLLPETRQANATPSQRRWFNLAALREILHTPTVGLLVLIFFLATFGFGGFESTLALLNKDLLGFKDRQNLLVFAYVGVVLLVTQGLIYRRLAKRLREETFMALGIAFMGLGVLSLGATAWYGWSHPSTEVSSEILPWVLAALTASVMGFAFLTPSVQALVSRRSDPAKQGEVLGVNQSASAMARILGPFVGLSLYKMDASHLLPYALGAGLILLMLPLLPKIRQG